uniref:hypothetical protein n=1 Tax=Gemmiger formicilis TaxID=745368 RepID=UPI00402837D9
MAGFTICAAENCNEKRMLPIIYKDTFWLWTPQKQMAVRLAGHYWVGKGRRRRKLCLFFSETPNEITKTGVLAFCKSPNRIEMHKKCQKGIDFMVDMLYSEDAKTIKEDARRRYHGIHQRHRKGMRGLGGYREQG